MSLLSFAQRKLRNSQRAAPGLFDFNQPTPEQFCWLVDFLADYHLLDPELPEIAELKEQANTIMRSTRPGYYIHKVYLGQLDPSQFVEMENDVLHIHERITGYVLNLWSVVRHHRRYIDAELDMIVADARGLHLIVNNREVVLIDGGAINPRRLHDPGNRYEVACAVIKEFTGVELDWQEHVGKTATITVTRDNANNWQVELKEFTLAS